MIDSKAELLSVIDYEFRKYFPNGKKEFLKHMLLSSHKYHIWKYVLRLRNTEFYKNSNKKLRYVYSLRLKNQMGRKLGFDIPENCFDKGLLIYHIGPIVVNSGARIGTDCEIVGDLCIGNTESGSQCPVIGNRVCIGRGAVIIGAAHISDDTMVAAKALVTKKFESSNMVLVGIPAVGKYRK